MCKGGLGRTKAVVLLFLLVFLALTALGTWLIPMISMQSAGFAKDLPGYTEKARDQIVDVIYRYNRSVGALGARGKSLSTTGNVVNWLLGSPTPHPTANASPSPTPPPIAEPNVTESIGPAPTKLS